MGIGGELAASRLLSSFLFRIGPMDPATNAAASLLVLLAGLVAGYIPARRPHRPAGGIAEL